MVALSKLKAGDTVHFRCGGSLVVEKQNFHSHDPTVEIKFKGYDHYVSYYLNGRQTFNCCFPFDIIRVEPALRWEDVKPGMAFLDDDRDIIFYIGPDFEGGAVFSLGPSVNDETTWFVNKEDLKDLTPAPEHNIEVAK